jgi:hypothetical protein
MAAPFQQPPDRQEDSMPEQVNADGEIVEVNATVTSLIMSGPHGEFVFAEIIPCGNVNDGKKVTVSLQPPVWKEKELPEKGDVLVLSDIRAHKNRKGAISLRANGARILRSMPPQGCRLVRETQRPPDPPTRVAPDGKVAAKRGNEERGTPCSQR